MDRILPILFLDDEGRPLEFSLRGLPNQTSLVSYLIKKGGGIIHVRRNGLHTIVLDKPDSRVFEEGEYFSCQYISDSCEANCLQDLNRYRLNKNSKYGQDYDANLVLLKKKSWKDIPFKSQNDPEGNEESSEESRFLEDSTPNSRRLKNLPRPYCDSERKAILAWIIKNKVYSSVGGNAIWMIMEKEEPVNPVRNKSESGLCWCERRQESSLKKGQVTDLFAENN